jgi:hypothetical protein
MAGYIGNFPTPVPLTGADLTDGIITSAKIADGTIVGADLGISVGGKVLQVVQGSTYGTQLLIIQVAIQTLLFLLQ